MAAFDSLKQRKRSIDFQTICLLVLKSKMPEMFFVTIGNGLSDHQCSVQCSNVLMFIIIVRALALKFLFISNQ